MNATNWMRERLARGPVRARDIRQEAAKLGYHDGDLADAFHELGARSTDQGLDSILSLPAGARVRTQAPATTVQRNAGPPTTDSPQPSILAQRSHVQSTPVKPVAATAAVAPPQLSTLEWRNRIRAIALSDAAQRNERLALALCADISISVDEALALMRANAGVTACAATASARRTPSDVFAARSAQAEEARGLPPRTLVTGSDPHAVFERRNADVDRVRASAAGTKDAPRSNTAATSSPSATYARRRTQAQQAREQQ